MMKTMRLKLEWLCVFLFFTINLLPAQSFSVQRAGNGEQALILIPGFACSGEVWKQTVDVLQENFSCYVLTMPGFAGVPPEKNPSFDSWARQIIEFIQKENIEKPVLIGHSMGGGLALYIASTAANLLKGIIVVDALPCLAAVYDPNFRSEETPSDEFDKFENKLLGMSDEQFCEQARFNAASLTVDALRYDDLVKWSLASDRKTYAKMYCDYFNVDLRSVVTHIAVPGLILLEHPFKGVASRVEPQFGNSPVLSIEYAEKGLHFIMFDDWEWYIRAVTDYLAGLRS